MKDRIAHILRAKNLTATEFADLLGIQRSGISHLLAGRNKPSLDFIMKLKDTFPEFNLDWLIMGKGPITVSEPYKELVQKQDPVNENPSAPNLFDLEKMNKDDSDSAFDYPSEKDSSSHLKASQESLKSIILVYDDDSFEVLSPKIRL